MRGVLFEPTEEQRRLVRALAGFGIVHDDIAKQVGCEPKTLRKHFREELDRGSVEATAKVAQSLFQMATTGKNVAAAIFWMKARAGWREKSQVEHEVRQRYVISATPMSDEELMRIAARGLEDEDDEDAPVKHSSHPSYVINRQPDMTQEEWLAKYSPHYQAAAVAEESTADESGNAN